MPPLQLDRLILPDPRHTVPTPTRQIRPAPRQVDADDTVFVALQHELRLAALDVPELDRAVFGAGYDPLAIGRDGDGEDVVLVRQLWILL